MARSKIITGQYVYIEQTAASLLQRGLSWGIDLVVMSILQAFATFLIMILFQLHLPEHYSILFTIIVEILGIAGYPLWTEIIWNGQTFGKKVCQIRVVRLDGSDPSLSDYFLRWLLLTIDFFYFMIGVVFIIFTRNSQRLGDLAAGTVVVRMHEYNNLGLGRLVQFARKDYAPYYPEASRLTASQAETLRDVLWIENWNQRIDYCQKLGQKVRKYLGINKEVPSYEEFLTNIYNDYQYYSLHSQ